MQKRMARELEQLPGSLVDNTYTIRPNVVFLLPNNYPFLPPKLEIYSKDHVSVLAKIYSKHLSFIKKYNIPIECICCFSVTCMWSPCHTCKHVYDEYKSYSSMLKNIIIMDYFFKRTPFDELIHSHIASYLL